MERENKKEVHLFQDDAKADDFVRVLIFSGKKG